jgi:hypothetical protein
MPKFAPVIETKEKMIVPVVDISSDPILKGVAEWLNNKPKQPLFPLFFGEHFANNHV